MSEPPHSRRTAYKSPFWAGSLSRIAVAAVFGWTTTVYPVLAQTPPAPGEPPATAQPTPPETPPPAASPAAPETAPPVATQAPPPGLPQAPNTAAPASPAYTVSDLQYLLGPIALYPDPLLALILPASMFPQQVIDADAWLTGNEAAATRGDFAGAEAQGWDASVQALLRFPDVIEMLAEHPDWMESLGVAFATQPGDVSTVVQMLRAQAASKGNLKSTPQQNVVTRQEGGQQVIYIQPANPERIYVPTYDSSAVFNTAVTGALLFGTGVLVGSAWNNNWGWNNRRWNTVWVHPPGWNRPPHWNRPPGWRPPPPGRPGRPPGQWRPDRPGNAWPDRPNRPGGPGVRPDRPGVRPDRPGVRPERPDRPGMRPDRPGARPDRPGARPERPAVRPDRPGARPERPNARPPQNARPRPPQNARPGQNARPRPPQNVRPPQNARPRPPQNARPGQNARPRPQQRPRPNTRQAPRRPPNGPPR